MLTGRQLAGELRSIQSPPLACQVAAARHNKIVVRTALCAVMPKTKSPARSRILRESTGKRVAIKLARSEPWRKSQ